MCPLRRRFRPCRSSSVSGAPSLKRALRSSSEPTTLSLNVPSFWLAVSLSASRTATRGESFSAAPQAVGEQGSGNNGGSERNGASCRAA